MPSEEQKYQTVITNNTFFFFDREFDETYEVETIGAIGNLLSNLQAKVQQGGPQKSYFEKLLEHEHGLRAILALNGVSNETLKRLITLVRILDDDALNRLTYKAQWAPSTADDDITEWSTSTINRYARSNEHFRKGLVNLFFEGSSNPHLIHTLRPFELRKLSIRKLKFDIEAMIDTLVRYKVKGSLQATKNNNAENIIAQILGTLDLPFETGDLPFLRANESIQKRTMDFIIPDKNNPVIIIESSFMSTTGSGQGDKARAEVTVGRLIQTYYPNAQFIGFVDGIGWYVRKEDLRRMVSAYDDVFTFHSDELVRFRNLLVKEFNLS